MSSNADQNGTNAPLHNGTWRILKIRFTREAAGEVYGRGRMEMWVGETPGNLLKIMEFLGDEPGGMDENIVFVGPRTSAFIAGKLSVYYLTSEGYNGDHIIDLGYLRFWSHSR